MLAALLRSTLCALVALSAACGGASQQKKDRVIVSDTKVEVLDAVSFAGEAIAPASHPVLDAIAQTLDDNPDLMRIEVRVHVADGDEAGRQERADRRAKALVDYLIGKGVAPARLAPVGLTTPPASPENPVEFFVAKRISDVRKT